MIEISVSSVARNTAPLVPPNADVVEAAGHLRRVDVPAVVADAADEVVGIVTESDVVAVVAEGGRDLPVESFMSRPVVGIHPSTPIGIAADRMRDADVALPAVVDEDDTYEGLVTRERLAPYLSRHRLAVDWKSDPLSLGAARPRTATGKGTTGAP